MVGLGVGGGGGGGGGGGEWMDGRMNDDGHSKAKHLIEEENKKTRKFSQT